MRSRTRAGGIVGLLVCMAACSSGDGKQTTSTTVRASGPVIVTSSDATVRSLWQADSLAEQVVTDDAVVGVVQTAKESTLHAVSALTGKALWSFALPVAEPQTLRVLAAQGVAIAEIGHTVGSGGGPQGPIVTQLVVLDARTGAHLWSEHVGGRTQTPPVAIASGVVVLGDPVGTLIARNVRSGRRVWQRSRPRTCPRAGPVQYDEALVGDGPVLAASYQCSFRATSTSLVERLDRSSGAPLWQWSTPALAGPLGEWLSLVGAASSGGIVMVSGHLPPKAPSLAGALGRTTTWPTTLGRSGSGALVALDATTGHPRWNELGNEGINPFAQITFVDTAVCESIAQGFQCRDDVTGEPTRPVFLSGYDESAASPYYLDARVGFGGTTAAAVNVTSATNAVSVDIAPVRGTTGIIARLNIDVGATPTDGSRYSTFVVGGGQLTNGTMLVLLRRVDVKTYPLLAISVTPRHP